jgi:hypothetical protein
MTDDVQVEVSRHCELVLRGTDRCAVLDRLAAWVNQWDSDILITGLHWTNEWVLDPDGVVDGDQRPNYIVTMQFRTGAQIELDWGKD